MAFTYLDGDMIRKLIVTLICPRLEYAGVAWSPSLKKHIRKLERIQRVATKMARNLSDLPYEVGLRRLKLQILENRKERGDLIAVYRVMNGLGRLDRDDLVIREKQNLRGHGKWLRKAVCTRDIKKNSFTQM